MTATKKYIFGKNNKRFCLLKKKEGGPNKFLALPNSKCFTFDNCLIGGVAEEGVVGGWWTTKASTYLEFSKIVLTLFRQVSLGTTLGQTISISCFAILLPIDPKSFRKWKLLWRERAGGLPKVGDKRTWDQYCEVLRIFFSNPYFGHHCNWINV